MPDVEEGEENGIVTTKTSLSSIARYDEDGAMLLKKFITEDMHKRLSQVSLDDIDV